MQAMQDTKFTEEELAERGFWDSRPAFWLAACGSAVGLGNIWRFPWRVSNGGGAVFLIAYFIVLFVIGMPLLTQEMALGQKFRGGDVEAYGRIHPRLRGIGLSSVFAAYGIVVYYVAIIAIALLYVFKSWQSTLPYANGNASAFLEETLAQASAIDKGEGKIATELWGTACLVWVIIFFCVYKGVSSVSKVVMITMPVPIVCLLILMIKGFTLDGAGDGIKVYTWTVDWDRLSSADLWMGAIGQCFFSLSICMGVMTAYSSYSKTSWNIVADEKVVALCDVGIAYCGGFVIYSVLGHLQKNNAQRIFCWDVSGEKYYGDGILATADLKESAIDDGCIDTTFAAGGFTEDNAALKICKHCYDALVGSTGARVPSADTVTYMDDDSLALYKGKVNDGLKFVEPLWYTSAGTTLCFVAYPTAIATFKGSHVFATLFFFCLFLLGIDSAFSMVEALSTALTDTDLFRRMGWGKFSTNGVLCVLGLLLTTIFCTDTGLFWLDLFDYWINNYGLQLIGALECVALGWVYKSERGAAVVGERVMMLWGGIYWTGLTIATLIGLLLAGRTDVVVWGSPKNDCGGWNGKMGMGAIGVALPVGLLLVGGGLFYCIQEAKKFQAVKNAETSTYETLWAIIDWHGPNDLRRELNSFKMKDFEVWNWAHEKAALTTMGMLNVSWGYLIKYFIPSLLLILTMNQLRGDLHADPFCSGGGFGWRNLAGVAVLLLMLGTALIVMIKPELMAQEYDNKTSGTTGLSTDPKSVGAEGGGSSENPI